MTKPLLAILAAIGSIGFTACSTLQTTTPQGQAVVTNADTPIPGARAPRSDTSSNAPTAGNTPASAQYTDDNRTAHRSGLNSDPRDPNGTAVQTLN